jgi:hypothetical protein
MSPRFALIDASATMRLRISQHIGAAWPDAAIELIDPHREALPGRASAWRHFDAIIIGLVEDSVATLELIYQLNHAAPLTPILFLQSPDRKSGGEEALLHLAKASLPRENLNPPDLRNALTSLLETRLGKPIDTGTRAITAYLRARSLESQRNISPEEAGAAHSVAPPRVRVVCGALGQRRLIAAFLRQRWPEALIEEIDPFSQTLYGLEAAFTAGCDLLILGNVLSHTEMVASLGRMRARADCPPILMLTNRDMLDVARELAAAGASAVLIFDSLSARDLTGVAERLMQREEEEYPPRGPLCALLPGGSQPGRFSIRSKGERHELPIEHYRFLAPLAAGDLSHVFFAERTGDGTRAVIKIMNGMPVRNRQLLDVFIDRYRYLSSKNERCIVKVLDAGLSEIFPYLIFEYLASGDLRRRMRDAFAPREALSILHQLAQALAVLHTDGLAHMDLKPENLFFREDDSLVLIDFAIATRFGAIAGMRIIGEVMGTPFYMSPEHGQGLPVDGRSDLYSTGVIFYEMLSGEKPFTSDSAAGLIYKHIHGEIPLLPGRVREYQPIVDRLMAKHPDERYQSAAELALDLHRYAQHLG